MSELSQKLEELYTAAGITLSADELKVAEESLQKLKDLRVTGIEAQKAVIAKLTAMGVTKPTISPTTINQIENIAGDGTWHNIKGKIIQLWDPNSDKIQQTGLIGDESGSIKFTTWKSAESPIMMEEGKCYSLNNVVNNPYQGRNQLSANRTSKITLLDIDIEVASNELTIEGFALALQSGSGLIKRCPQCNRALNKGICNEHGKVEGVYDLRIKLIVDDGHMAHECLLNRELTEKFTGITLDQAIKMATEALDTYVVHQKFSELLGMYVSVSGAQMGGRYINTTFIQTMERPIIDLKQLLENVSNVKAVA